MTETKAESIGDIHRLVLRSQNATMNADNSFDFNVNLTDIEGDVVRCGLKKVMYPPPATYTPRRLWFAPGNTFFPTYAPIVGQVNDYNTLYAKYGQNNWLYFYVPSVNVYARLFWNNVTSSIVRQTIFSSSLDGINWSANTDAPTIGIPNSGSAATPCDFYEIDITTLPVGTNLQNIHIPQLRMASSFCTFSPSGTCDMIGQIPKGDNPYVSNDITYKVEDTDCSHEVDGNALRSMTNLNLYFSRVNTPTVKEPVVMPWSIEIVFYTIE